MSQLRQLTEQERMRAMAFECLSCGAGQNAGSQYPWGMNIPRTLELWCDQCQTTSIHYQTTFQNDEAKKAA